ncbi:MAG TPA: VCBS repeat-containing protein [Lysobacter sp.]|nr:VCBS repeat-containing protein [Lysobacter sp.]
MNGLHCRGAVACLLALAALQAVAANHDINGDGYDDVVWRHADTGINVLWRSANSTAGVTLARVADLRWKIVGTGDFNGDGRADLLWRHSATGQNSIWRSGNAATSQRIRQVFDARWQVIGTGDFDGDGRSDVLWRHPTYGYRIWPAADASAARPIPGLQFVAIADVDGDGRDDLVGMSGSYAPSLVRFFAWRGADATFAFELGIMSPYDFAGWQLQAVGDFDRDGRADLFWRNIRDGRNVAWRGGFPAATMPISRVYDLGWQVASAGDYNGDGRSDLFWRHQMSGRNSIWPGANAMQGREVASVSTRWSVVP